MQSVGRAVDQVLSAVFPSRNAASVVQPECARPYYLRGLILLDQGDHEGAIVNLMTAIEIDDFFLDAYHALAQVYETREDPARALRCYEELVWRYENDPQCEPLQNDPASVVRARQRALNLNRQG